MSTVDVCVLGLCALHPVTRVTSAGWLLGGGLGVGTWLVKRAQGSRAPSSLSRHPPQRAQCPLQPRAASSISVRLVCGLSHTWFVPLLLSQAGCPSSPRGPRTCIAWRRSTGAHAMPSPSPSPATPTTASQTQPSRSLAAGPALWPAHLNKVP